MPGFASNDLEGQLGALIPNLRAFAIFLAKNPDVADDLVQETLVKAWGNRSTLAEDSNLRAWLFTILRNTYFSRIRKRRLEVEDADGVYTDALSVAASQPGHMDMVDFTKVLDGMSREHREALILVGAEGFSYEDAALMCGCAVGTMKSRVSRARAIAAHLMGLDTVEEIGSQPSGA